MNLILGTAGHIDHGKSSLVRALTGIDPDRLPEEQKRGVTIELGFANLELPHPKSGREPFELGLIDVPGHADFINNMVAGVGALDVVVFAVAADDAWMPQSEEHLHVLSYLGVKNAIIALTKIDVCEDVDFTVEILREELEDSALADCPIIPVSSHTGEGLDRLKSALAEECVKVAAAKSTAANKLPRLAIDRVFSPKGIGTVVTGTLTGAPIAVGDTLMLEPQGLETSVRQVQNHSSQVDSARPGMRTALNVADLPIASRTRLGAQRGSDLLAPGTGSAVLTLDIEVTRSSRQIPGQSQTRAPIKLPRVVAVHIGTAHRHARMVSIDVPELYPGQTTFAQLRFTEPVHCLAGDRLVIRDASKLSTLAGGVVLDPNASSRRLHRPEQRTFLEARAAAPDSLDTFITSALQRDSVLPAARPVTHSPFTPEATAKVVEKLRKNGKLTIIGDHIADGDWWKSVSAEAAAAIKDWHEREPDEPGLPIDSLGKIVNSPAHRDLLVTGLCSRGFEKRGDMIASTDHLLSLPPQLEAAAKTILQTLNDAPLSPPNRADLLTSSDAQKAYKFLLRQRDIVELDAKITIAASVYRDVVEKVTAFINDCGPATASGIRQHLDTTRKVLMPLLEKLDADKITRRNGDTRTLYS